MSWLAASLVLSAAQPEIPRQTLVFFNARIATKERRYSEALTLWLVRNALFDAGQRPTHDGPFTSVVWASTGALGVCQDGLKPDDRGAGLWPIALHNHVLISRQDEELPSTFDAFEAGRQQRRVSLSDVLSDEELQSVTFSQTRCWAPAYALFQAGLNPLQELEDRLEQGPLLQYLLKQALRTLKRDQITTTALIEARLFDLDLAMTELRERKRLEASLDAADAVRGANMSAVAARQAKEQTAQRLKDAAQQAFLMRTLSWTPAEWLTLSRQRREFLFTKAKETATDAVALQRLTLGIIDALVAREDGQEAMGFIAMLDERVPREEVTEGARGERLLALGENSEFRERAVISLHRGVKSLERGEMANALRSFAFALAHSDESRASEAVHALARRWLSYVLARYQSTPEVLATLKALVPRQDFNPIIEDLVWAAALRSDATSFDRLASSAQRGGSFDQRLVRLSLLAHGKATEMVANLKQNVTEAPFETLRFTKLLVEKLEREEADVRLANRILLAQLISLIDVFISEKTIAQTNDRNARDIASRIQAMLEALGESAGPRANTRALELSHSAFAGALRLAPADPLPWPFVAPETSAPSAFEPIQLVPVEWRDSAGALVFGWRITE